MSNYIVGAGSTCHAANQSGWGSEPSSSSFNLVNMTSESIDLTVDRADEGNLFVQKTASPKSVTHVGVAGSVSTVLRPEFVDWLFYSTLGTIGSTTSSGTPYTLSDSGVDLPLSTMYLKRGTVVTKYSDLTIRSLSLEATAQDYVKADIDLIGSSYLKNAVIPGEAPTSFEKQSYRCTHARLLYANEGQGINPDFGACGINALDVESCTINFDNGVEESPATYCSGLFNSQPIKGLRSVTVNFNLPYSTKVETFKNSFFDDLSNIEDPRRVALLLGFTTNDTDEYITVYIPHVSITEASNPVSGTGIIDTSFTGEAVSVGNDEPVIVTIHHANDEVDDNQD